LRLPYSRSSFERIGHEVGRLYTQAHVRIEEALITNYVIPEGAKNISVSIDRVAVPMEETLPGKPLKTERTLELEKQLATVAPRFEMDAFMQARIDYDLARATKPGPKIARNYRMAYCATVTLHGAEGKSLHTIRYGRMPKRTTPRDKR
jgi:hypothetical protein